MVADGPDGLAVLRFRGAIWSSGLECHLAELYVVPALRGQGLGRALMEAAMREARGRGADRMDIGVDEPDAVARRLYESLGFTNRTGGEDGANRTFKVVSFECTADIRRGKTSRIKHRDFKAVETLFADLW